MRRGSKRIGVAIAAALGCRPAPSVGPAAAPDPTTPVVVAAAPALRIRHDAAPVFVDPKRRERLAAAFPGIRSRALDFVAAEELPGLAVGVVVDGELALFVGAGVTNFESRGAIDERTVFRVGSLTKLVTATVILGLRDEGKLGLDDPAEKHVPELARLIHPTRDVRRMTIRELLLHRSGLPRLGDFNYTDPEDPPTRAEIVGTLDGFALRREPGAQAEYSNLGFMLLGLAIAGATGEDYTAVVERRLFAPLGIRGMWTPTDAGERLAAGYLRRNGQWVAQAHWNLGAGAGAGGLYMDVAGLARFAGLHLGAWPARDEPEAGPVRRASLREMARFAELQGLRTEVGEDGLEIRVAGRGLAWSVAQDCRFEQVISHHGGTEGYTAAIYLLPQRGVGVVLLSNAAGAPLAELAEEVLVALDDTGALARRRSVPLPALTTVVEEVAGLLAVWDGVRGRGLLARQGAAAAATRRLERELEWARETVGVCGAFAAQGVAEPDSGTFAARCERGRLMLQVGVTSTDPPKIGTLKLSARGVVAREREVAAATRVVALLSAWDAGLFAAALSPDFVREGTRRRFAAANPGGAACELGAAEGVRPDGATFAVRCGERELRVAIDGVDAAGRVGRLTVDPAPRDRCGRVPGKPGKKS